MYKFNTLKSALGFLDQCQKSMVIVLGDDDLYWVVTFSAAQKLEKKGYEILPL